MDEATREADAVAKCESRVKWYLRRKNLALYGYWFTPMAVFTFTAITPVFILITDLPKPVQALPAALATIAAGAIAVFQMPGTVAEFQVTATRLDNELDLFKGRSGKYANGDDPTGRFIVSTTRIYAESITGWRQRLLAAPQGKTSE